ncbi:MAG: SagB/ThcOx family dehydrogenase, partial [Candidatus Altiarchaeales archaeon]|nr:SagB/ThcOx family dehydrogenase [Candidatus Altiarchaeales archaeon]
RDYKNEPLSIAEVSQLLWSAQGLNREWGRTAPSAGATYPLETYVVVGLVDSLPAGLYHYLPLNHSLEKISDGDIREGLADCSLNQRWVEDAAVDIVFAAEYSRTTNTYGKRGERYVHMEAGHAAQNVYLQCVSLKCGTVVVGAFDDICIKNLLSLPESQEPLYVMPVGRI